MLLCRTGLLSTSDGVGSSVASSPIKDLCDCSEKSILCRYAELRVEETQKEGIGFIYQSCGVHRFPPEIMSILFDLFIASLMLLYH